ncbi:MAG: hypothetical protein U1E73_01125 [Planctomycetota bacterium]
MPLLAQSAITLQVDTQPPATDDPSAGSWVSFDGPELEAMVLGEFRLRAVGTEGGWYTPVLCVQVAPAAVNLLPSWLSEGVSCNPGQLNLHEVVIQSGGDIPIWRQGPFQRMFDIALTGGTGMPQSLAVRSWSQPFLTQTPFVGQSGAYASTRLWKIDAPLWTSGQGQVNKSLWTSVLQDLTTGQSPPRQSCFSSPAALRQAVLLQSLYSGNCSITQALDFLSSPQFTTAVTNGWLKLVIQCFSLRAPTLPDEDFVNDPDVPGLGNLTVPPMAGISHPGIWVVVWPNQASNLYVQNWPGVAIVPGQTLYFDNAIATPPLLLSFHTTTGVAQVQAFSAASVFKPSRWGVIVPTNVVSGMVAIKAGLDAAFADVAPITVAPQTYGH